MVMKRNNASFRQFIYLNKNVLSDWLKCLLLFCSAIALFPVHGLEKKPVLVYAYHLKPPFIVDMAREKGIYYDFSSYINARNGPFDFQTIFVPRKRVEHFLANNQLDGIVIGVNPTWFDDNDENKYLWTPALLLDQDEFVSLIHKPIVYTGAESLVGRTLGGVLGFYYFAVNDYIKQGLITRVDTIGEKEVLQMLLKGRADVGIVSRSTFNYLIPRTGWNNKFFLSPKPHETYARRILVPHNKKEIYTYLLPLLQNMDTNPEWQAVIRKYNGNAD